MARGDGIHRTSARNARMKDTDIDNAQAHNEREKSSYVNQDIVPERTPYNVHFKTPTAGYKEMFEQMRSDGVISTRGLKADAEKFGELKVGVVSNSSVSAPEPKNEKPTFSAPVIEPVQEDSVAKTLKSQRQQEYVGKVYKCPNCGNVVGQSDAVCDSCGYHLSGKQAVSSAMDFQQKIMEIEMSRKKTGFWDQRVALNATDKQIVAFIKSYPIPNSIEDIVEFFYLAIGNIDVAKSKKSIFNTDGWDGGSRERAISNAWVGKLQQIYKKAELFFPNEPEFAHIKEAYLAMMKELKL